jgi:hypothetical protein
MKNSFDCVFISLLYYVIAYKRKILLCDVVQLRKL